MENKPRQSIESLIKSIKEQKVSMTVRRHLFFKKEVCPNNPYNPFMGLDCLNVNGGCKGTCLREAALIRRDLLGLGR